MPSRAKGIPSDWITTPNACRQAGLSWGQLYRLILRGDLEALQVGRDWLVNPKSLAQFMESQQRAKS